MNELDRIVNECVECGLCVEDCEFLSYCGEMPRNLAQRFKDSDFKENAKLPYLCNQCGLCQELCPAELDTGKMCLELRGELVQKGLGPLPGHRYVRINQDFSASDSFTLAQADPARDKCERVFFPGCTLPGYSPALVMRVYDYLRQKLPGTGIVLGCCGEQTLCLGDGAGFNKVLQGTVNLFKSLGSQEVIVACPLCFKTFKKYAPELNLTFISEVILKAGLPPGIKTSGSFALHDSCSARREKNIHESVRALVREAGCEIEEMAYSREKTRCCGVGGMVPYADMGLAGKITRRRVNEASHDILTYCASCREVLAAHAPALHFLDLIFNPDWDKDRNKKPATGKERRENQAQLKATLQ